MLAFVLAALSLLIGLLSLLGALLSSTQALDDTMSDSAGTTAKTFQFAITGIVVLVLGAALLAGGSRLITRHRDGRTLLAAAAAIILIACGYSILQTTGGSLSAALPLGGLGTFP